MSETIVIGTGTVIRPEDYREADRFESVGHPVCFSEVKIVDEVAKSVVNGFDLFIKQYKTTYQENNLENLIIQTVENKLEIEKETAESMKDNETFKGIIETWTDENSKSKKCTQQ